MLANSSVLGCFGLYGRNSFRILNIYEKGFLLKRSSLQEVFCRKGVLKNLAKFTKKYTHAGASFLKKLQEEGGLKPARLLKEKL